MSIPGSASPLFFTAAADAAAAGPINSVRFNNDDSAYLNRSATDSGSDVYKYTVSWWMKIGSIGTDKTIVSFATNNAVNGWTKIHLRTDNRLSIFGDSSGTALSIRPTMLFRDTSAWYHCVVSLDTTQSTYSDQAKFYINGVQQTDFTGTLAFAQNTALSIGEATTHHVGVEPNSLGSLRNYFDGYIADLHVIEGQVKEATDFGAFNDSGVWQHAVYTGTYGNNGYHLFDFANESGIGNDSSGNDNDFTVNNISQASLITWSDGWTDNLLSGFPATNCFNGTGTSLTIGGSNVKSTWTAPSSIPFTILSIRGAHDSANIKINGTDVTSQFSSGLSIVTVTGISSPLTSIDLDNTNGLGNARISAIRIDGELLADDTPYPGANNDVLRDVPTNGDSSDDTGAGGEVSGNYCTGNPLHPNMSASVVTLSEGNLKGEISSGSSWHTAPCTIGVSSGKWYFEQTILNSYAMVGIAAVDAVFAINGHHTGTHATGIGYFNANGDRYTNNTATSYGASYGDGDVIGCAFDMDARSVTFYKNGVSQGEITSIITANKTYAPVFSLNGQDGAGSYTWNFGQRAFAYSAPSGYKALCTANLPDPTIADSSDYFDTKLYDGTGAAQTISGLSFSPDFVWLKRRSSPAESHTLFDTVRGAGKELIAESTSAEYDAGTGSSGSLIAFNSDGFDLGTRSSVNASSSTNVAWAWDAGSSTVSNTDGTLTSSVRASQTAGTSIVTYTGSGSATSVGHGLGAAPDAIIVKNRSTGGYKWPVYHSGLPANASLALNIAWAYTSISDYFDAPSSTVFNISSDADVNKSGDNFVAYCFSSVEGFSKFGTYAGNSNADGPFVYLGFKPALIIIKGYDFASNWFIHDYKRPGYNQNTGPLRIAAEAELTVTTYDLDILSNGFKMRTGGGDANQTSKNFAYFAWAQNPFQANGGLAR